MVFVRNLPNKQKLEIYKKTKGWCLSEGYWNINCMKDIMNEKAKDVFDVIDYELFINPMECYKQYVCRNDRF